MRGASLRGAHLIGADLRNADLRLADVLGADFRGADLSGADLTDSLFLTYLNSRRRSATRPRDCPHRSPAPRTGSRVSLTAL